MGDSYGQIIRHRDHRIDLGAVSDETVSGLLIEYIEAADPEHSPAARQRQAQDNLELIRAEIDDRLSEGRTLPADLDTAYRCESGCCH